MPLGEIVLLKKGRLLRNREDKLKQAKKEKQGIGSEEGQEPESAKTLKT